MLNCCVKYNADMLYSNNHRSEPDMSYRERVMDAYGCEECGGIVERMAVECACCDCHKVVDSSEIEKVLYNYV